MGISWCLGANICTCISGHTALHKPNTVFFPYVLVVIPSELCKSWTDTRHIRTIQNGMVRKWQIFNNHLHYLSAWFKMACCTSIHCTDEWLHVLHLARRTAGLWHYEKTAVCAVSDWSALWWNLTKLPSAAGQWNYKKGTHGISAEVICGLWSQWLYKIMGFMLSKCLVYALCSMLFVYLLLCSILPCLLGSISADSPQGGAVESL